MDDQGNRHGNERHGPGNRAPVGGGHGHGPGTGHGHSQGQPPRHSPGHGAQHAPGGGHGHAGPHGAGHGHAGAHGGGHGHGAGGGAAHGTGPGAGTGRGAPPESTGAETNYIIKNMQARTPMVVRLMNNEEVRGWIEYYDRQIIKLNRLQPPHLFIRKENIKYMYKDEEAQRTSSRDRS